LPIIWISRGPGDWYFPAIYNFSLNEKLRGPFSHMDRNSVIS
jgi:hypothetical protein